MEANFNGINLHCNLEMAKVGGTSISNAIKIVVHFATNQENCKLLLTTRESKICKNHSIITFSGILYREDKTKEMCEGIYQQYNGGGTIAKLYL